MKKTSKKRVAAFALALTMACTSMPVSMETVWAGEIEGTGETEGAEVCESHIYGENGCCTSCSQKLLVSVTTADENPTTSYYTDFALAIEEAVKNEECKVTLLSDISLADTVRISSGKFTLDLDEYILDCSKSYVLNISGGTIDIIAKEKGKISGRYGIFIYGGMVKVAASIEATSAGSAIYIEDGNLTVSGGTIKGYEGIRVFCMESNSASIVIKESANIIGNGNGINIYADMKNTMKLEITGGTVSGNNNAILYSISDEPSSIIISGGTISCGEDGRYVFRDNMGNGSAPGSLILKGGSYPNGIILGNSCCDLSEMLEENYVCLDSDGNVVALTEGEKNYNTIRSIVEDTESPVVQYQIGEQEAVTLSDEESVTEISIVEGEELSLSASDRLIGLDTLSYHISQTKIEDTSTIISESWQEYSEALKLEKSNGCYLYVQAKDKLNNTTVHAIKLKFIPEITDIPTISGTYGQSLSEMTLSKTEGESDDEIQGTWSITQANKENIYPTVGTDATYEVTFTPTDNANYSTVTKTTTVTVSKATPYIVEYPTANEITRGETLSNSSLTGGKVQCSETNPTLVEGTFTWGDASRVPSVSDSNVTEFEVVFTPSDTTNYDIATTNVKITVNKIENVPNRPQSSMNVSHKYIKIDDVPLPNGWKWKEEDKEQELKDGQEITATAQYTAEDKVEYSNLEIKITVTRSECEHTEGAVVWDGTVDTDIAPVCDREGIGHTTCTKCSNVVRSGIHVRGLDHEYKSEITKKATYTEEGIRTYTCTQPGCTDSYTEVIEKLKRPSYSGNSGNSGSTTNPPTTEEPTTEEPSTEEPSTDESTKDEPTTKEPDSTEENPIDWKQDENGVFYEKEDGTKATGWYEMEDGDWYYFNEDGYRQTGWEKDGDTWYYLNETGVMQTGWQKDNDTWYYLSESGAMQTGWQKDGESWYYLSENGSMQTGWQKDGDNWYYLSESGSMQTGWQKDGESWYYLSGSGAMQTGWLKDGETWYYLNASGSMKTGWLQIGADWFYLNANGSMAADTYIGIWYVDKNGYYIPSKTK